MAEVTAALVKELREKTGAGMMDCKKALAENNADVDAAIDWLRTKGLAKAAKKSGRVAAEGLVAIAQDGTKATVLELNSETDFVARNTDFQQLALQLAQTGLQNYAQDADSLGAVALDSGKSVSETVTEAIATIGENLTLRRVQTLEVEQGLIGSYVHNAVAPNLGKIGVIVALKSSGNAEALQTLGKSLAMHIAANNPVALKADEVPQDILDREKSVLLKKAKEQGKPEHVIEKIVESGIKSYCKEVCLLDQGYVMDPSKSVSQAIKETEGAAGSAIELVGFVRFGLGEGIEKEESDFASEVAAAAAG